MNLGFKNDNSWSLNQHLHSIRQNKLVQILLNHKLKEKNTQWRRPIRTSVKECLRTERWSPATTDSAMNNRMVRRTIMFPDLWTCRTTQPWMTVYSQDIVNKMKMGSQVILLWEEIQALHTNVQNRNPQRFYFHNASWISPSTRLSKVTVHLRLMLNKIRIQENKLVLNLRIEVVAFFLHRTRTKWK